MANRTNSLSHTKWVCKYHIVFVPKYRRKIIYNQYRADLQEIIRTLCKYKDVEILEGHMMPDHAHLLLRIPPKRACQVLWDKHLWSNMSSLQKNRHILPDKQGIMCL